MADDATISETGEDGRDVDAAEVAEVVAALEKRVSEGGSWLSTGLLGRWRARLAATRGAPAGAGRQERKSAAGRS